MPSILKRFTNPDATPYHYFDMGENASQEEIAESNLPESIESAESPAQNETEQMWTPDSGPERRKTVDYARVQAEAIISEAHRRAEEVIQEAKDNLSDELELIREGARQEGRREGYAEGIANAMRDAKAERAAEALKLQLEIQQFLEKSTVMRERLIEDTKDELLDVAIAAAEKVIRVSLKSSRDVIARIIQGATDKLKRKEWVHIYVAACDVGNKAQVTPELAAAVAGLSSNIRIIPMADDESGTCIIEMPDTIIDASVSTQIANIREAVSGTDG